MLQKLPLLTTSALSLLLVALTACGGDDDSTSATPTAAGLTQVPTAVPTGLTLSASATATMVIGDETLAFEDGKCDRGTDDSWLAVNIGQVGGTDYFGMAVGAHSTAQDARPAKGGGEFTDGILLVATQAGSTFTMTEGEGNKITVDAELQAGDFVGTTIDGQPISGSFRCSD
jgi:hypothetical protein